MERCRFSHLVPWCCEIVEDPSLVAGRRRSGDHSRALQRAGIQCLRLLHAAGYGHRAGRGFCIPCRSVRPLAAGGLAVSLSPDFYAQLLKSRTILLPLAQDTFSVAEMGGRRVTFESLFKIKGSSSQRAERGVQRLEKLVGSFRGTEDWGRRAIRSHQMAERLSRNNLEIGYGRGRLQSENPASKPPPSENSLREGFRCRDIRSSGRGGSVAILPSEQQRVSTVAGARSRTTACRRAGPAAAGIQS